jgi:dihydrodipicolinate synthase/N-acetylneuraminate lyase
MAGGGYGAITASGNYLPRLLVDLVGAARRSPARAAHLQQRLTQVSAAVEGAGVPGVKVAAAAMGLHPGVPRSPLRPLRGAAAAAIRRAVRTAESSG